jgi:8-oxo-dGDP phosphatase
VSRPARGRTVKAKSPKAEALKAKAPKAEAPKAKAQGATGAPSAPVRAESAPPGSPALPGYRLVSRTEVFVGPIFSVVTDEVELPDATVVRRDLVRTRGAVIIVALDDQDRVTLIRQYRQAVGRTLWELPAGMLDVAGETPLAAAARELAEEVDLVAARWDLLVELHPSPGFTDDFFRVFLARELAPVPETDRFTRRQEEAQLVVALVDLDEAVAMVERGEITNGGAVAGLLAAARARDQAWATLRHATDEPRI